MRCFGLDIQHEIIPPPSRWDSVPLSGGLPVTASGHASGAHAVFSSLPGMKLVPSRHRRSMITAILRAAATAAFLCPLRAASRTAHAFRNEDRRTRVMRMFSRERVVSGRKLTSFDKSRRAVQFEGPAVIKVTFLVEVIVD
jgi:hypothetical protein